MKREPRELVGVVLHLRNYADSDRIVELLAEGEGRISLLARGARASKKRFAGKLDLFVSLRAQVIPHGNLWTLQGADLIDARIGIRARLEAIERAAVILDCARSLTPERLEADDCLRAVERGLDALARGDETGAVSALPDLLTAAGWMPDLEACSRCGGRDAALTIVDAAGNLLCSRCAPDRPALSRAAWLVLQGEPCASEEVASEVERWVVKVVESHRGQPLRSTLAQR